MALREEITSGRRPPLTRLVEADLAERLAVSRTPLRQALQQLEAESFVTRPPGGGLTVAGLHAKDVADLFWLRDILEEAAGAEATRRAGPKDLRLLDELVDRMDVMLAHPDLFLGIGRAFHSALADLVGNARTGAILDHARLHVDRYWAAATSRRPERTALATTQHRGILAAMHSGDATGAGRLMRSHIQAEAEICLETVRAIEAGEL